MATTNHHDAPSTGRQKVRPGCLLTLVLLGVAVWLQVGFGILQPHVTIAAEKLREKPLLTIIPGVGEAGQLFLTNSLLTWLIAILVMLFISYRVGRQVKRALETEDYVLTGFTDAFVAVMEYLYNLTESMAGKWTRTIFPFFATITLLVLIVNWMELLPGMDTIGFLKPAHGNEGYIVEYLGPIPYLKYEVKAEGEGSAETRGESEQLYEFVPLFRVVSTDLTFTLALALVSVLSTQVLGLRAQGARYLEKFFNLRALFFGGPMGLMDFIVGLLELVSEFSKILSFTFRLFGNLFAGTVLLFVMGALASVSLFAFYLLEVFVGLIQAFVFGILTAVFMSQATQAHH